VDRDFLFPVDGGRPNLCARLGMVTGLGLAGVIRVRYPRWILWSARALLAHGFYAVIAVAMALGLGLDYARLDAVKMLFWSAVLNGALAPPLLILVVLLTSRADVMGEHRNGALLRWLGWTCAGVMLVATTIMFATAYLP